MQSRFKGLIKKDVFMEMVGIKSRQMLIYYKKELIENGLAWEDSNKTFVIHEDAVPYMLNRKRKEGGGRPSKKPQILTYIE